jgi:hypothetical protein
VTRLGRRAAVVAFDLLVLSVLVAFITLGFWIR